MVKNPITGKAEPWKMTRAYGCNSIIASENLLTFRSGAAGYYDWLSDSGTGNLGGFRSGCTSNLIAANGVLNAPDYTRTCSCSYQNQTSLALVPMPDVELWSVHRVVAGQVTQRAPVDSLGLNFGAPGDRRGHDGSLWVEYPTVSGDPLGLAIEVNASAEPFRKHTSAFSSLEGAESRFDWVYASGLKGVSKIELGLILEPTTEEGDSKIAELTPEAAGTYSIDLLFAAPDKSACRFDVIVAGTNERKRIELSDSKDGSGVIRCQFTNVPIDQRLSIRMEAVEGEPVICGLHVKRTGR